MPSTKSLSLSYGDEREKALLLNFNQGAKLHSSHLWSCHEHQYLYEFSYDDEQEIFCFFLWWWTRKSDVDNFQFLMAAKLHTWQRVTCLVMSRAIKILLETRNILLFLMVMNKKKVSTLLICSEGKTAPGRPPRARLLYPIHFTQMAQSPINIGWPDSMECQSKYSGCHRVYVCQKRYCLAKVIVWWKYQKRL